MSSSIFEVRESESDSEKVLDFGLDTCEENGIMSTQLDGELPKDHTYTKEPDVLQDDMFQGDILRDNDSNKPEEMGDTKPVKSKTTKVPKTKIAGKGKAKQNVVKKKEAANKKGKTKKDDISEEVDAISESAGNGQIGEAPPVDASTVNEEDIKSPNRGRKRKNEDKETVNSDEAQDAENLPDEETKEKSPKKRAASTPKVKKVTKAKNDAEDTTVDTDNLPPGWVRKSVVRKSGKTAGQIDVYIYSPEGLKFRSKPEVASYLTRIKSNIKLDNFDFGKKRATEKPTSSSTTKTKQTPKKKPVAVKPKTPVKIKSKSASPKKSPKLLVKIVSSKPRKSKTTKESPAKVTKTKGKAAKANKKK